MLLFTHTSTNANAMQVAKEVDELSVTTHFRQIVWRKSRSKRWETRQIPTDTPFLRLASKSFDAMETAATAVERHRRRRYDLWH